MQSPSDIYEKLVTLGEEWAEKHAAAELLEETKKVLLASLMGDSEERSMSAKESEALASAEYAKHIEQMVLARKRANKAKVRYESARVWVEMLRTKEASERAAARHQT